MDFTDQLRIADRAYELIERRRFLHGSEVEETIERLREEFAVGLAETNDSVILLKPGNDYYEAAFYTSLNASSEGSAEGRPSS